MTASSWARRVGHRGLAPGGVDHLGLLQERPAVDEVAAVDDVRVLQHVRELAARPELAHHVLDQPLVLRRLGVDELAGSRPGSPSALQKRLELQAAGAGHPAQARDALLHRGVGREEPREAAAAAAAAGVRRERVDDVERLRRRVDPHRDRRRRSAVQRLEGVGERVRVADVARRRSRRPRTRAGARSASWMIIAAIGARMIVAIVPIRPSGLSSSPPPKNSENWRKLAIAEIAPATMAAMLAMRMSRFLMCAISCARTPSSSRGPQRPLDARGHGDGRVLGVAAGRERVGLLGRRDVDGRASARRRARRAVAIMRCSSGSSALADLDGAGSSSAPTTR